MAVGQCIYWLFILIAKAISGVVKYCIPSASCLDHKSESAQFIYELMVGFNRGFHCFGTEHPSYLPSLRYFGDKQMSLSRDNLPLFLESI
jgi:hypothetical protein